jgi:translation elongation factor aEF-1 beta
MTSILQIKVMPEGIDTDLSEIKKIAEEELKKQKAVPRFEEQSIAFGLKAIIITTTWPEEKDTELATDIIKKIPGVSQADITDYRRAIG